jgi:aminoglycoside 3-N-acetyltransferase
MTLLADLADLRRRHGLRDGLQRRFTLWKNRFLDPSTASSLEREIRALGVGPGDLVLVHSAFSKLGYVRGGPQTFIEALTRAIGAEGTIMMPSFPFNGSAWDYASRGLTFDVTRTPAVVGQLQEHFRRQAGTLRSLHPTHPFCAKGPLASELLEGHHRTLNPFGMVSPLGRFVTRRGKCLLVGVGLKNCSPLRVIEEKETYPHPVFQPDTVRLRVIDDAGREFEVETLVHSKALSPLRRTDNLRPYLESEGRLRQGRVGLADTLLLDCRDLDRVLRDLLARGITPYSHLGPRAAEP